MRSLKLLTALKSSALFAALAIPAGLTVGCHDDDHDMKHDSMKMENMSKDQMMKKGDDMVMKGQMMKDDAMKMNMGEMKMGMSKDQMMMKGDQMMKDGMMMKDKAMMMKM